MADPVHQAVQAEAVVAPVHVVVVPQAGHVAEASPVADDPNQSHQRVAADQSQSKYHFTIHMNFCDITFFVAFTFISSVLHLVKQKKFMDFQLFIFNIAAIVTCRNRSQRAVVAAVTHALALVQSHTSVVTHAIPAIAHCQRVQKTDITPDQALRKTTAARADHQIETKAWTIKRTLCPHSTTIKHIFLDLN